jgi:hypothetical protein
MYGIDKSISFNFLVGKELLQLCIGLYQLILNFTDQLVISAECVIRLKNPDGSVVEISCDSPELSGSLTCLLGRAIEAVQTEVNGELNLSFSGGFQLSIVDSNEDEESFTITMDEHEIVV